MPAVRLGNPAPLNHATGERVEGPRITDVYLPESWPLSTQVLAVTDPGGAWAKHGSGTPSWVSSDSAELQAALAAHWGCPAGQPATDTQEG